MVTYNHEKFISRAIESVLMQETRFRVQLIIGEDCSTDGTRGIVKSFADKNPDRIVALYNEKNIGANKNTRKVLERCKGKYIAMLEGDDYWTETTKLQEQVDFLETHPDYTVCFHNALIIHHERNNKTSNYCHYNSDRTFELKDILCRNFIHTGSCVFKNNIAGDFLDRLEDLDASDWYIHIFNAQIGKIFYMNKVMSVYRAHSNGKWTGMVKDDMIKFYYRALIELNHAFQYKYNEEFLNAMVKLYADKPLGYKDMIKFYLRKFGLSRKV
jgi:glycosyltransferase involved in cell wall biosynthesis